MLHQGTKHRILKIFNTLGLWSIPVLSIPLLLPLVLAQSISWSLQSTRSLGETAGANISTQQLVGSTLSQRLAALRNLNGQTPVNFPTSTQPQATAQPQPVAKQKLSSTSKTSLTTKATPTKHSAKSTQAPQSTPARQVPQSTKSATRANPTIHRAAVQASPEIELQVKVAYSNLVPVSTSTNGVIVDDAGRVLRSIPGMQPIYAQPGSQGIDLNDWEAPTSVWLEATQGGFVFVGEHWYRGRVRLVLNENKILAVNHVDLEDYLPSVVGSEMYHDWSIEALKAQAVAARSYALVYYIRPAGRYFQIGSDEYYQVYKGLTSEGTTPWNAVRQTTGQVLSYKGGVVESLYASSDELVAEVHKGFGMSQQGAQKLASQGYNYLQILGSYYPGTTLAQLKPY